MQRRKYLLGLGSLAAGGAAAIGTGAFSSAEIKDRSVQANVVNDDVALLQLDPTVSQHARLTNSGELLVDIQDLSQNSEYTFKQIFRIKPTDASNSLEISASLSGGLGNAVNDASGYGPYVQNGTSLLGGSSVTIDNGEYVDVGATVVTTGGTGQFDGGGSWAFTITADEA